MSCFIDVKKCFDTIDHDILLKKLKLYGIRESAHLWFSDYLNNRKQYVSANGYTSKTMNISTGVPQGSALGPFLFLIFINDMPQHVNDASCNMFADDNSIYSTGVSVIEMEKRFQKSINDANSWYQNNRLPVNIVKTLFMISGSTRKLTDLNNSNINPKIVFNGETLNRVEKCMYLGLTLEC